MESYDALSERGKFLYNYVPFLDKYASVYQRNTYHETRNPEGIINFGMAENTTVENLWIERFRQTDMTTFTPAMTCYFDFLGTDSFRRALAKFFIKYFNASTTLDPRKIVVSSGAGASLEMLATVLADPDDCFLVMTPVYSNIQDDIKARAKVRWFPINTKIKAISVESFRATIEDVEASYKEATSKGEKVRGMVFLNPCNPTGLIYNKNFLEELLEWGSRHQLHMIINEVYALSILEKNSSFTSVLSLETLPDPNRTHFIWSFSKDFALNGFRCGVSYSWNDSHYKAVTFLHYLGSVPVQIQHKLTLLLSDEDWLDKVYFPTYLAELKNSYVSCSNKLKQLNIPYLEPQAAYSIWADLSQFLPELTKTAEIELFEGLLKEGLYINPGCVFHCVEPGWFRITFTSKTNVLSTGLERLESLLLKRRQTKC